MQKPIAVFGLAALFATFGAEGQNVLISDFNTVNPLVEAGGDSTWTTPVSQLSSFNDAGYKGQAIGPVNGGDPNINGLTGPAPFAASLDLSGLTELVFTARLLPVPGGNSESVIRVSLSSNFAAGNNHVSSWDFPAASFNTGTFVSGSLPLTAPTYLIGNGNEPVDLSKVDGFFISGDRNAAVDHFAVQFARLEGVSSVPEPSVKFLAGLGILGWISWRLMRRAGGKQGAFVSEFTS